MKKLLYLIPVAILIISCGGNNADEPEVVTDNTQTQYGWDAGLNDSTGNVEVKRSSTAGPDTLTSDAVIRYMNEKYTNVQMKLVRTSNDTIYISIPNATYLTQQMGSSGPQVFFADAVYNLTEIPGFRYVNFQFEEGDHASPSVLSRETFSTN